MEQDYDYLFRRRHALHRENREVWERSRAAYYGGEAYIRRALVRHVSEVEPEFEERLRRAYYFNYPRKLARLITQFILSVEPQRDGAEPELVEDFSRTGLRANEVMRQFSTLLNIYGGAALSVEMPYFSGEIDCERKKLERIRPAVRAWSPLEVADWSCGADGQLDWIIFEERILSDNGPFQPPSPALRRKLFTRTETMIFEREAGTGRTMLLSRAGHKLGCVPALLSFEPDGFGIDGGHYFEDVVRISDAILNNESEAQMNVVRCSGFWSSPTASPAAHTRPEEKTRTAGRSSATCSPAPPQSGRARRRRASAVTSPPPARTPLRSGLRTTR